MNDDLASRTLGAFAIRFRAPEPTNQQSQHGNGRDHGDPDPQVQAMGEWRIQTDPLR
jgi:hypothetical protein